MRKELLNRCCYLDSASTPLSQHLGNQRLPVCQSDRRSATNDSAAVRVLPVALAQAFGRQEVEVNAF